MKLKLIIIFLFLLNFQGYSQEVKQFSNPSDQYRPWLFWSWLNDMVTKKGITSDLEQFKKFGVRGTMIMLIGSETVDRQMYENNNMPNPIVSQTPEFFNMWKHAAEESERLGLTISTQLGPGWCHSGGPLVKPDQAVQHIAFTEIQVKDDMKTITLLIDNQATSKTDTLAATKPGQYVLLRPGLDNFTSDISIVAFPDKKEIKPGEVINLTKSSRKGKIEWKVPAGNWIIRRYAIRNALAYNRPAPVGGKGFESDKLDKDAVDAMFSGMVGKYIKDSPKLVGKTIRAFEADSWEVGNPEWSGKFKEEFIKRRGYDPIPWLITYKTGQIVGSKELTERFQNDMYLTQTDLFADNFFSHLAAKADSLHMDFMTEPYIAPFDPIRMAGRVQVPMCEFWVSTEMMHTVRWASSAANTYGHKVVAAEAFTGRWNDGNWKMDPFAIKRAGDLAFANGVNKMVLHASALQPWGTDFKPGMQMYFWGTIFIPGQTWWEPGKAWVNYLSRCQYMLTQGKSVADVVGLMPTLKWRGSMPEGLHKKYNYDLMTEETLLNDMDYHDGSFHLPSGASYRILFLPKTNGKMSPEILEKLIILAKKGGTIVCQDKPSHSPGLTGYPQADAKVKSLVARLWGKTDGKTVLENKIDAGKLVWINEIWNDSFDPERKYFMETRTKGKEFWDNSAVTTKWSPKFIQLLQSFDVPDLEVLKASGEAMAWGGRPETIVGTRAGEDAIAWTHRQDNDTDIYFISNQVATENDAEMLFRVKDKIPQLWDPETGKLYSSSRWSVEKNRIKMTIPLSPFGSVFVIFRPKNKTVPATDFYNESKFTQIIPLTDKWKVSFPKGFGAPETVELSAGSFTNNSEFGIKYFSGTATFEKMINITTKQLKSQITLDLGSVKNLAEVIINGSVADTLWKPPFKTDISKFLKAGSNRIVVKITNTWWNRMVGDEQLPDDLEWLPNNQYAGNDYRGYELKFFPKWIWTNTQRPSKDRITFAPWKFVEKDSKLEPAGLIGPVKLTLTD